MSNKLTTMLLVFPKMKSKKQIALLAALAKTCRKLGTDLVIATVKEG